MPRPRVSRPAWTRPAKATHPIAASAPQGSNPSPDIYDVSDPEKERAAARRRSLRDGTSTRNQTTSTETIQQQKALEKAKRRRDAAIERLDNITSTSNSDEEEDEAVGSSNGHIGPSQRVTATPSHSRPTDLSGLDLDDSMFDDLNTTIDTVGHASAQRSAETSTLSISQFRRRPRAGSFLSRDDGPIRPSSRAGPNTPAFSSTLNFGVFKRRAREPSILSTAQKPRPQRPEPEQDSDDDEEGGEGIDKYEVAPEAESTPLRRSRRGSEGVPPVQPASSIEWRKRKSTEGHERRLRSSPFEVHDDVRQSIEQPDSDEESPLSSPPSLPQHEPSTPTAPPLDPELMAPPLSSDSSESDEDLWPPIKSIPKARTRQPASVLRLTPGQDDVSDISSPPSLTHSPNYAHSSSPPPTRAAKSKRKAVSKPPRKVTTADLTGLLPRRRQRGAGNNPFGIDEDESEPEVDISGLGEGDDELAHLDVRMKRRPASRVNIQNQATANPTRGWDKATLGPKKRISRTYGRLSDKENFEEEENDEGNDGSNSISDLGQESSQMLVEKMGEELKTAVRKFEEVDKWELSFEERTRSSSPMDAR